MDNKKEMADYICKYILNLNPNEVNILSGSIISNKTEKVITNILNKKGSGPHGYNARFYQNVSIFFFQQSQYYLDTKLEIQKKKREENCWLMSLMNID